MTLRHPILLVLLYALISLPTGPAWAQSNWTWERPTPCGHDLHDIWMASADEGFAVGDTGTILHRTAAGWTLMDSPSGKRLNAVWGFSTTDVLAVGRADTVLHYDGSVWTSIPTDFTGWECNDVWGVSSTHFWVACGNDSGGIVYEYQNGVWSGAGATADVLHGIHGTGENNVFAVGEGGIVNHWDGSAWAEAPGVDAAVRASHYYSVWAFAGGEVFIAGEYGDSDSYRYYNNEGSWEWAAIPGTNEWLKDLWAISPTEVYCTGNVPYYFDGAQWSPLGSWSGPYRSIAAMSGTSSSNMLVVGYRGLIVRYDGSDYTEESQGTVDYVAGIWSAGPGASPIAVGGEGYRRYDSPAIIFTRTGSGWEKETFGLPGLFFGFYDVCGKSASDIYAVGSYEVNQGGDYYSYTYFAHYDGASWSVMDGAHFEGVSLTRAWCAPDSDVFAVGSYDPVDAGTLRADMSAPGIIYRYDGSQWAMDFTCPEVHTGFNAVWGSGPNDIWVGGDQGYLYRNTGSGWTFVECGADFQDISGIWGTGPDDVYVAAGTFIRHWDGSEWGSAYSGSEELAGVAGFSSSDIWTAGGSAWLGTAFLAHYDGSAWTEFEASSSRAAADYSFRIAGRSNRFWMLTDDNGIVRRDGGALNLVPVYQMLLNN